MTTATRTLNEITQDIAKYHEALNLTGGDVAAAAAALGMSEDEFNASYDKLAFEDASKLDGYIQSIEMDKSEEAAAQAMVDQWEERIKHWRSLVKTKQKSQEWKKARLKFNLEVKGEKKIVTDAGRVIAIQNNGGKQPLIIDEAKFNALAEEQLAELEKLGVIVMQPMVNKEKLAEELMINSLTMIDWATLGERGTHVRIK